MIAAPPGTEVRSPLARLARVGLVLRGLPKTILFNIRYLPFRQAIRLPILVSHRVALPHMGGTVTLPGAARTGTVLLGFGSNGAFDFRRERSVWQLDGHVVFLGPARLGNGFKLAASGCVTFGPDFVLSAESQIICREAITFGTGCLISWEVLLLDTDFHPVEDRDGNASSLQEAIVIGDRVWIGARATVLKGVRLANDSVVAAGTVVSRSVPTDGALIGGNPAEVLRTGVRWRR
jgi:acetyltransferase-like isoleucine patch superfamily enzyme